MKKLIKGVFGVFVGLCVLGILFGEEKEPTTTTNEVKQEEVKQEKKKEKKGETAKDKFEKLVSKQFKESNIDILQLEETKEIEITFTMQERFTGDKMYESFKITIFDFLQNAKENEYFKEFSAITFNGEVNVINTYGEKGKKIGAVSTFAMSDIERIQFENIPYELLFEHDTRSFRGKILD